LDRSEDGAAKAEVGRRRMGRIVRGGRARNFIVGRWMDGFGWG
jgi:hypothetical protein